MVIFKNLQWNCNLFALKEESRLVLRGNLTHSPSFNFIHNLTDPNLFLEPFVCPLGPSSLWITFHIFLFFYISFKLLVFLLSNTVMLLIILLYFLGRWASMSGRPSDFLVTSSCHTNVYGWIEVWYQGRLCGTHKVHCVLRLIFGGVLNLVLVTIYINPL